MAHLMHALLTLSNLCYDNQIKPHHWMWVNDDLNTHKYKQYIWRTIRRHNNTRCKTLTLHNTNQIIIPKTTMYMHIVT